MNILFVLVRNKILSFVKQPHLKVLLNLFRVFQILDDVVEGFCENLNLVTN